MIKATKENIENISEGAKVKMKDAYGGGTKYFVCYLTKGHCLLADSKSAYRDGTGYIHSIWDIARFEMTD